MTPRPDAADPERISIITTQTGVLSAVCALIRLTTRTEHGAPFTTCSAVPPNSASSRSFTPLAPTTMRSRVESRARFNSSANARPTVISVVTDTLSSATADLVTSASIALVAFCSRDWTSCRSPSRGQLAVGGYASMTCST